jgi:hypothetical protein
MDFQKGLLAIYNDFLSERKAVLKWESQFLSRSIKKAGCKGVHLGLYYSVFE